MALVQGVESMEELLLNAFLAGQELHVVDEQDVRLAMFAAEADQLIVLNGLDVFVGEFFGRKIRDARAFFGAGNVLANGVQQMRLAQTHPAIKEKRIVGFARRLRDGHGGGMGVVVVLTHDEGFEGVFGIQGNFRADTIMAFDRLGGQLGFGFGIRGGRAEGAAAGVDAEFHLENLPGSLRQHVADQSQVVVLEPDLAKIVGHFQDQRFPFQGHGLDRKEPQIVNVRVQHGAQQFLRSPPDFIGGCLHLIFAPKP